jgi:hypothetical protein
VVRVALRTRFFHHDNIDYTNTRCTPYQANRDDLRLNLHTPLPDNHASVTTRDNAATSASKDPIKGHDHTRRKAHCAQAGCANSHKTYRKADQKGGCGN